MRTAFRQRFSFSLDPPTKLLRYHYAVVFALMVAAFPSPRAVAAEPAWPTAPYDYVVVDQDLRAVLQQFGFNTGLRIVISDAVQGKVHGRLPPAAPRQFLDHLTELYGLDWYYDGAVISVSAKSEAQTTLLTLKTGGFAQLLDRARSSDFLDQRYQLRPGPDDASAIVSGPPQYLAMIKQVAANLAPVKEEKQASPTKNSLVIIRGATVTHTEFAE